MAHVLTINGREYLQAGVVGKHFGYTRDYILMLAREGKIDGQKIGHRWYVNEESVANFFKHAEVARKERTVQLRKERQQELRARGFVSSHKASSKTRTPVTQVVVVIAMCGIIGSLGYFSMTAPVSTGLRASAGEHVLILNQIVDSIYRLFVSTESVSETVGRDGGVEPLDGLTPQGATLPVDGVATKTVHTSIVIAPGKVLTETTIEQVRNSFSDEVSVSVDPHNPDTGIIVPHFKEKNGESYRFLLVPVQAEGRSP